MLHSADWYLFTGVSIQSTGPIFKVFVLLDPWWRGPVGCPETSVTNYQYTLRNISEERRSHLLHDRILKSCTMYYVNIYTSGFIDSRFFWNVCSHFSDYKVNSLGDCAKLVHSLYLAYPFLFIICQSLYHSPWRIVTPCFRHKTTNTDKVTVNTNLNKTFLLTNSQRNILRFKTLL